MQDPLPPVPTPPVSYDLEKVTRLLEQQDKSAKMLIRRDLELTRANERLRALDKMKTDFVSVATHQLRTPLSAIKWTLSMLLNGDAGAITDKQRELLQKANDSNDRMVALLKEILFSDQVESNTIALEHATSTFPELPQDMIFELQPVAAKRAITLLFEHPSASYARVLLDPKLMRAVLQNLLENAIKYSKDGGTVTLRIAADTCKVVITVTDTGIGIPLDSQKNVFTRFFRAENAVRLVSDGSGLGLFIVESILERNKGTIRFESKENVGTTFTVELPTGAADIHASSPLIVGEALPTAPAHI